MLAVLSPAKTLDFATPLDSCEPSQPRFAAEAERLARSAARLSEGRLRDLMAISPALARLNAERFRGFGRAPERPALFAFAGDVYAGLDARTLDQAALARAQERLRLLSGLYGLLRPLDAIRPHRLEMGVRWAPRRDRLTDWWGGRIADALADEAGACGADTVVNLASGEYWAAVAGRLPPRLSVVAVEFRDGPDLRIVSFHAKRARGAMARWMLEQRPERPDDLRAFDRGGYRHDPDLGGNGRIGFARP